MAFPLSKSRGKARSAAPGLHNKCRASVSVAKRLDCAQLWVSYHPYITFTLVPPVPNTCPPASAHTAPGTTYITPHVPVLRVSSRSLDANDSDRRARGRVGREYARARLGHKRPMALWGARVDVEGPTMEAVASGCATWGVWGRRRVEEVSIKAWGKCF
jgi:hypothetical protein